MRTTRVVVLLCLAICITCVGVEAAAASEGGARIASAPHLKWGRHQEGIGTHYLSPHPGDGRTFWRVHVRRGDRITITVKVASTNGCGTNQLELFAPSVHDSTVGSASGIDAKYVGPDNSCFKADRSPRRTTHWQIRSVPFHGGATLWIGVSSEAPTFSFTAHVHHRDHPGGHHSTG